MIKLLPPYCKKGENDLFTIRFDKEQVSLKELAVHLSIELKDMLGFDLIDKNSLLTAEFSVNGKAATTDQVLNNGDQVTIIPYICGG